MSARRLQPGDHVRLKDEVRTVKGSRLDRRLAYVVADEYEDCHGDRLVTLTHQGMVVVNGLSRRLVRAIPRKPGGASA